MLTLGPIMIDDSNLAHRSDSQPPNRHGRITVCFQGLRQVGHETGHDQARVESCDSINLCYCHRLDHYHHSGHNIHHAAPGKEGQTIDHLTKSVGVNLSRSSRAMTL